MTGGTDRPGELCSNFSISNDLTRMVNFPARIPDCDSHSPVLLDFFLSSNTSICSTMAFPPLGILIMLLSQFLLTFQINLNRTPHFIAWLMTILVLIWHGLHDHLRDVLWKDIFNIGASAAASELCEWVQLELMYIYTT